MKNNFLQLIFDTMKTNLDVVVILEYIETLYQIQIKSILQKTNTD